MPIKTHGEVKWIAGKRCPTAEYRAWQNMRNRCLNRKTLDYAYYGARGITICKRWDKYEYFLIDMGRKPTAVHTLDRKNVNKNYYKSNCRWAIRAVQSRNRTDTVFSESKAKTIRKMYATGKYFQRELVVIFGGTQAGISQIIRNASWREIGDAQ